MSNLTEIYIKYINLTSLKLAKVGEILGKELAKMDLTLIDCAKLILDRIG